MGSRHPRSRRPELAESSAALRQAQDRAYPQSRDDRGASVPLAVVIGAHGLSGELRVKPYNPSSRLLASLPELTLREAGRENRIVAVRSIRPHSHGLWLVALTDCDDRDTALGLRGAELCVPRAALPALAEGEHYLVDLVGLEARLLDGRVLGCVEAAIEYPASQVLRLRLEQGCIELPLLPPYVVELRLDERVVIVDQIEDLELEPHSKGRAR